jgi:hypothetical protein
MVVAVLAVATNTVRHKAQLALQTVVAAVAEHEKLQVTLAVQV